MNGPARAAWLLLLLVPLLAGCMDGPEARSSAADAEDAPGPEGYGPTVAGTRWRAAAEGPVVAVWRFEGVGSCTFDFSLSGVDKDNPGVIGYRDGAYWQLHAGSVLDAGARTGGMGHHVSLDETLGAPRPVLSVQRTVDVVDVLELLVATPQAQPSPFLDNASLDLSWFCAGDVELVSVEGSRELVFWGTRPDDGLSVYGGMTHAQVLETDRTFTTPSVRLLVRGLLTVDMELRHPDGTENWNLHAAPIDFVGDTGDYALRMQRVDGPSTVGKVVLLAGLEPLGHLDELLEPATPPAP